MDLYCPNCGEPWDHDSLHDEAGARYGIPFYRDDNDRRARQRNPAYDSDAYQRVFAEVSSEFRSRGCPALASYGAKCNATTPDPDEPAGTRDTRAAAAWMFVIESRGAQSNGSRVVNPSTMQVLTFATRKEARAYAASITPDLPSKDLPLVVTKLAPAEGARVTHLGSPGSSGTVQRVYEDRREAAVRYDDGQTHLAGFASLRPL